jgi:hypothetical protein
MYRSIESLRVHDSGAPEHTTESDTTWSSEKTLELRTFSLSDCRHSYRKIKIPQRRFATHCYQRLLDTEVKVEYRKTWS